MARLADLQTAAAPAEATALLPPLYRSEAFAEDLPGWADPAPEPLQTPAPRFIAQWLTAAPLTLALLAAVFNLTQMMA
ncbi:MAG: hypothetical protein QM750_21200 [Rubrivivax sp.]